MLLFVDPKYGLGEVRSPCKYLR